MVIRKFNQKNYGIKNLIFTSIVIFLVIVLFFKLISVLGTRRDNKTIEIGSGSNQNRILGETITLVGKIYSGENSNYYDILFKADSTYGLKSNKFDLKNFAGLDVEIEGSTMSFIKDLPVIELGTIKIIGKDTIVKDNSYNFTKNLITFNFARQLELKAELSEDESIDISFQGQHVTSVEVFMCNKINKSQDCETLGLSYKYSSRDNFISYGGYIFYRYDDKEWITFNDDLFGYIFKDVEDQTMLDLSSTIEIVNKEFVLTHKKTVVTDECATNGENIIEIDDSSIEPRKDNILMLNIQGTTNKKRKATCEISFDLWNKWKPTKISLEFDGKKK